MINSITSKNCSKCKNAQKGNGSDELHCSRIVFGDGVSVEGFPRFAGTMIVHNGFCCSLFEPLFAYKLICVSGGTVISNSHDIHDLFDFAVTYGKPCFVIGDNKKVAMYDGTQWYWLTKVRYGDKDEY